MRSPRMHFLLALIALVAVSSMYGVWYSTVSKKSNEVVNLESQITVASGNVSRIDSARAALSEIVGEEGRMRNYFISESNVVSFINELEALGLTNNVVVKVLSVSKEGPSFRQTLTLSLSIKGTFDTIMRTVGAIEYVPYNVSIATLSVQKDVLDDWYVNLNLVVAPASVATTATSTH